MMDFFTPFWRKKQLCNIWFLGICIFFFCLKVCAHPVQIKTLRVEQKSSGLFLDASLKFDLDPTVIDTLEKGIPLYFVSEVSVLKDRWYWYDDELAHLKRTTRIAYMPLARRWRVHSVFGDMRSSQEGAASLNITVASLEEALRSVRSIKQWKILDGANFSKNQRHNVSFSFYLDVSKMPRPFQLGLENEDAWMMHTTGNVRPEVATVEMLPP